MKPSCLNCRWSYLERASLICSLQDINSDRNLELKNEAICRRYMPDADQEKKNDIDSKLLYLSLRKTGLVLKKIREYRGASIQTIASRAGISADRLYNIEHGVARWKREEIESILFFLEADMDMINMIRFFCYE